MNDSILVERSDNVATVILSNPAKLNALTLNMWQSLGDAFISLSDEPDVRCVVLRGQGDQAFAAGADVEEFTRVRAGTEQARHYADTAHRAMRSIAECRHPTIAAIKGACVGGGLEIASNCDLRLSARSSRFGVPVKRLGLVMSYSDLHGLLTLAGRAGALEILLEGRIFDAEEALQKGLLTRVIDDVEFETDVARAVERVVSGAPLVARWHKKFINRLTPKPELTEQELAECYACFDTEDYKIGYQAFLDKTRAEFIGQ
ncbi:enoyl-CoA hydratase [Pollutimonas subterranea]|uniref:Enoyl-CoA hydratase n=1 Tax=Pollutimonas subterranea TaxID=2045210 RepID=A0A2N4U450_9BURK|nr:enoyl-CoA hydratase-related protein [Pollutimonas subterranea]PLC49794.1 enoyl-CoA hydratase [Pollutimonas subterranea]